MTKKRLVRCCVIGKLPRLCGDCEHAVPHEIDSLDPCAAWEQCYEPETETYVKVRCVTIKEENP